MWIERLMAGISHQHVLSYNPEMAMKNPVRMKNSSGFWFYAENDKL